MDYFFVDETNATQGPVSEEVLKNLFFQNRINLADPVNLAGQTDWKRLADHFPDLEFYRDCPKCGMKVSVEEASCPHCHFPIGLYDQNHREAKRALLSSISFIDQDISNRIRELRRLLKEQTPAVIGCGCFMTGMVALLVLWLLPFIGFYLAVVIFLTGIAMTIREYFKKPSEAALREKAIHELKHSFYGHCPHCKEFFPRTPIIESFLCPACKSTSYKTGLFLYWVPYPNAHPFDTLHKDYSIFFKSPASEPGVPSCPPSNENPTP